MNQQLLHRKLQEWNMRVVVCENAYLSFPKADACEDLTGLQDSQVSWKRRTLLIEQRVFLESQVVHELAHLGYSKPVVRMGAEYRGWFYLLERWYARQLRCYAKVLRSFEHTAQLPWSPAAPESEVLTLYHWSHLPRASRNLWTASWRRAARDWVVASGFELKVPDRWPGQVRLGEAAGLFWLGPGGSGFQRRARVWCPK